MAKNGDIANVAARIVAAERKWMAHIDRAHAPEATDRTRARYEALVREYCEACDAMRELLAPRRVTC